MRTQLVAITLLVMMVPAIVHAQWIRHDVTSTLTSGYSVAGGDLDNDGDMDLVACSSGIIGPYEVHWFENDNGTWVDHLVTEGFDGWDIDAADLDNDGDLDIVACAYSGSLYWWENDNLTFTQHNIIYGAGGLAMAVGDVNGDGLLDIATAGTDNEILWVENTGGGWTEHILTNTLWSHGVAIGDITGDGMMDIAGSGISEDQLRWYENSGSDPWPETLMDDNYPYVSDVGIADFDGNGYGDIVFTDSNLGLVRCYLHLGNGTCEQVDLSTNFYDGWTLAIGDIGNDGDPDVAAVSMWLGVRYWDNEGGVFTQHNLEYPFGTGRGINMADMDADGDLDIVAVNQEGAIAWWEQPGGTQNPVELTVTPHNPPVMVPQGGSFGYDVHIVSHLNFTASGFVWSEAVLPNGNVFGPIDQVYLPFTPTTDIFVPNLTQAVPAFAPLGDYTWRINIGQTLQTAIISDEFPFAVVAVPGANSETEWTSKGWGAFDVAGEQSDVAQLPARFAVSEAYPNPFNASTRFSISLPDAQSIAAAVYDVNGRLVGEIAAGQYTAGTHQFTWNPAELASGVYFLRIAAGGDHAVRKLVYMK